MKIETVNDLEVGDVGFSTIGGRVGGWVSLGQALLRDECWLTHTWIVSGPGELVEAMPGGARIASADRIGPGYAYARLPLSPFQRQSASGYARELVGTPYSFLDYLALATHGKLLRARVTSSGHMICSQLVDQVLTRAGFQVFDDGRLSQDVTPGALFRRLGALGEVTWW